MSKKAVKFVIAVVGVAISIAAVICFIYSKKAKTTSSDEILESEPEEELDAADALDLSSLKFSQHYVDLR